MEMTRDNYPHLKGIYVNGLLTNNKHLKTIDILIGADFSYEFMTGVIKRPSMGRGPVATLTKVGWVVGGPLTRNELNNEMIVSSTSINFNQLSIHCCVQTRSQHEILFWKVQKIYGKLTALELVIMKSLFMTRSWIILNLMLQQNDTILGFHGN